MSQINGIDVDALRQTISDIARGQLSNFRMVRDPGTTRELCAGL